MRFYAEFFIGGNYGIKGTSACIQIPAQPQRKMRLGTGFLVIKEIYLVSVKAWHTDCGDYNVVDDTGRSLYKCECLIHDLENRNLSTKEMMEQIESSTKNLGLMWSWE